MIGVIQYFASHAEIPKPDMPCELSRYTKGKYLTDYAKLTRDVTATEDDGAGGMKMKVVSDC
jgi:hypothetical protein